ncbi:MAG: GSCFA domain-containing protein [Vicingaceae bacterium]
MKLRTEFQPSPSDLNLDHFHALLFCGSCFAENIGNKLGDRKFKSTINPFGISYNPLSLFKLLSLSEAELQSIKNSLEHRESRFFHFDFHSDLDSLSENAAKEKLQTAFERQKEVLKKAEVIFISLGTAWVYRRKVNNKIVNNCHKVPASEFTKELLEVDTIVEAFHAMQAQLSKWYKKDFKFVFTVSPVRHLKDGFRENQISKSTLHLATQKINQLYPNMHYFPAYELLLDDLRDYRFYTEDLVHPSAQAVEYIWQKFKASYLSKPCLNLLSEIEQIQNGLSHKAFHPESEKHQEFLNKLLLKMDSLEKKHGLNYQVEKEKIKQQLLTQ